MMDTLTLSLLFMMARRLDRGCCPELRRTPVFSLVTCEARVTSANIQMQKAGA
jgi:hypothetical protein